jgi:hypothetical protein
MLKFLNERGYPRLNQENIEFTMRRLREPIDDGSEPAFVGLI